MLSAANSNLVAGSPASIDMATMVRIKVLRPFYFQGKCQDVGKIIDYPSALAAEAMQTGKAEVAPVKAERVKETVAPAPVTAPETKGASDGNLKRG